MCQRPFVKKCNLSRRPWAAGPLQCNSVVGGTIQRIGVCVCVQSELVRNRLKKSPGRAWVLGPTGASVEPAHDATQGEWVCVISTEW